MIGITKPYRKKSKDDVVRVAQQRDHRVTIADIAKDFGIHDGTLTTWLRQAGLDSGSALRSPRRDSRAEEVEPDLEPQDHSCNCQLRPLRHIHRHHRNDQRPTRRPGWNGSWIPTPQQLDHPSTGRRRRIQHPSTLLSVMSRKTKRGSSNIRSCTTKCLEFPK